MKIILLFISLILLASCKEIEEKNKSEQNQKDVIAFYKCLLLDSDVVYNHVNSLVESVESLDPIKFSACLTTIYPLIGAEVTRCSLMTENKNNEEIKEKIEKKSIMEMILDLITNYVIPFLKYIMKLIGFDLKELCQRIFPDSFICNLL